MNNTQLAKTAQQAVFTLLLGLCLIYVLPLPVTNSLSSVTQRGKPDWRNRGDKHILCKGLLVLKGREHWFTEIKHVPQKTRCPHWHWLRVRNRAHGAFLGSLRPQGILQVLFTKTIKIYVWPVWDKELCKGQEWEVPPWHPPPRNSGNRVWV